MSASNKTAKDNAKSSMQFSCPMCKRAVQRANDDFPFCSPRCRTMDLGQWAAGDYRIAGESAPIPDDSESHF